MSIIPLYPGKLYDSSDREIGSNVSTIRQVTVALLTDLKIALPFRYGMPNSFYVTVRVTSGKTPSPIIILVELTKSSSFDHRVVYDMKNTYELPYIVGEDQQYIGISFRANKNIDELSSLHFDTMIDSSMNIMYRGILISMVTEQRTMIRDEVFARL